MAQVILLGAGVAGLTAARRLRSLGHQVTVVDKGRGVGGRLATRRIGEAVLDHGAQFFTTRGDEFKAVVAEAVADGAVVEWCRGFGVEDGYPRYRARDGMTSFAKWLAAGTDVRLGVEVDRLHTSDRGIAFLDSNGGKLAVGDTAIVTAPIPQIVRLFDRSEIELGTSGAMLRSAEYFATLALLVVADGPVAVDEPGGMQFENGSFTFIADNRRKGISPRTALTFHADHDYSLRRYDDDSTAVEAELLELAAPWIGGATVATSQLKKWRYAGPVDPLPQATEVIELTNARIALAGDAFAGPKVEGAFNSGLAAAEAVATT